MATFEDALRVERDRLTKRLAAIDVFLEDGGQSSAEPKKKGTMSAAARKKISQAQKLRWSKVKKVDKAKAS